MHTVSMRMSSTTSHSHVQGCRHAIYFSVSWRRSPLHQQDQSHVDILIEMEQNPQFPQATSVSLIHCQKYLFIQMLLKQIASLDCRSHCFKAAPKADTHFVGSQRKEEGRGWGRNEKWVNLSVRLHERGFLQTSASKPLYSLALWTLRAWYAAHERFWRWR